MRASLTTENRSVCQKCKGTRWVCENHPDQSFPDHTCCGGAGMPCECNPHAQPIPGSTVIWTREDGYAH